MLDKITKNLLFEISSLHDIPSGAVSFRKNGKSEILRSTANIEIIKKEDKPGIDIIVHSTCQNEACHIPVVVESSGLFDLVYNDFYIEDGADVTIVAGCGIHSDGESGHDGIHTFHIGKNAHVNYMENHIAKGSGKNKSLNPTTILNVGENSIVNMFVNQIGGVDNANRVTKAELKDNATLNIQEKVFTDRFNVAKTNFKVNLKGKNSKCKVVSRSVAKGESEQIFKANLIGQNECFGHVECDGILLENAVINSVPQITAKSNLASLSHEASIGKIAGEQIVKLMTLGLTEKQAEEKIIEGFLK